MHKKRNLMEKKLVRMRLEHRDLDESINMLLSASLCDQIQLQRMKRKKLALKDEISHLESAILPNIIA